MKIVKLTMTTNRLVGEAIPPERRDVLLARITATFEDKSGIHAQLLGNPDDTFDSSDVAAMLRQFAGMLEER